MLAMRSFNDRPSRNASRTIPLPRAIGALRIAALTLAAALLALPAAAQGYGAGSSGDAQAGYDSGYSYVRNLRGAATLIQGDTGDREDAEINRPVLVGDRLWVSPGSMLEVLLSDGNLLRIDGDSEVLFARLAGSPETRDETTELVLVGGNVQLVVFADAAGREVPRVELPNGTAYLEEAGLYRLTAGRGWSQVLARSGWAEVTTDRGSVVVRSGEQVVLDGSRRGTEVRTAAFRDDLERWGERLDRQVAEVRHVDRSLRHSAASLDGYGTWIDDGGRHVWRPRVGADWRPYWHGRWAHTPLGLTWVSSEPWGWAPYHYGTWDLHPRWGWVWYPGTAFAPAWVYWYWGPSHVAWIPAGYYTHHYRGRHHRGFRFGTYGWAGGHWGIFTDWVFCPTGYFGRPYQNRHSWRGRDWNRHHDGPVPRGVIAIDTRPLGRDDVGDGDRAMRALRSRPSAGGGVATRAGGELPDVTDFVARKRELPDDVTRRVFVDPQDGARVRVAGTPLAPDAAEAARPRAAVPRGGVVDAGGAGAGVRGGDGARDAGAAAPRARVSPRVPQADAPRGGETVDASPGVGRVRPRSVEPESGGDSGRPASGVRTRTIEPRQGDGGGAGAGDSGRPASGVRTRTIEPRQGGGAGAGAAEPSARPRAIAPREPAGAAPGVSTAPRRTEPRQPAGSDGPGASAAPRRTEPRRDAPPATGVTAAPSPRTTGVRGTEERGTGERGTGVRGTERGTEERGTPRTAERPRAIEPRRPAGDAERPAAPQRSQPSVRPQGDGGGGEARGGEARDGGDRAVRSTAPRTVTPDAYARSPRSPAPSGERPSVVVPPRNERRGVEAAPPAQRVVGGARSEAPSRPAPQPPAATRPSAPERPPAASTPSTTSGSDAKGRSGAVRPRSDDGKSGSSSSASSGSRSSSRSSKGDGGARASRRGGGGG
jgi:hypothetical protein